MSGDFIFRLGPYTFLVLAFLVTLGFTSLGFLVGKRLGPPKNDLQAAALNTALASIFVIVGLVLSFSFSFAINRYEERWHLVVAEADATSTTYLRMGALQPKDRAAGRSAMRAYVAAKIDYYRDGGDPALEQLDYQKVRTLEQKIWSITASELSSRPVPATLLVTQSVNAMFEVGADQRAALSFRLRGVALGLIVFVSLIAAFMVGLGFGQSQSTHWLVSITFCLLLVALTYAIIDLDSPQAGLIRVNLLPLEQAQQNMLQEP